jgi:hypothetical protein
VLGEHDSDLHDQFVAEFHTAMAETDDDFDTDRITRMVGRWWAQAVVLLHPDPDADAAHARLKAGDSSDLVAEWRPQPDGSQHIYRRTADDRWEFDRELRAEQVRDAAL